jgi:membrane fusion protein (multidrug efflux system)
MSRNTDLLARTTRSATVVIVLLAGSAVGYAQQQMPLPAVVTAPATMTQVSEVATLTGRAVASQKVAIQPRVTGFIESRTFTEGGPVTAGDVLFRIEDAQYRATVAEIEGALVAARAAESLARIERDRQKQLVDRKTVAQSALDMAEAELGRAQGEVMRLEAQRDKANLDLSYTVVKAPFDGITSLADVDEGALVTPQSGPLVTVTRTDPMTVQFPVSDAQRLRFRAQVAAGEASTLDAVTLTLADGSAYPHPGDIDFTSVAVSGSTDTVLIRAVFPNPDHQILDGALVRVGLSYDRPAPALTVPQQAVQRDMQGPFVMVVGSDSKVELRRIEVDGGNGGRTVVTKGLAEGDQVIVEGVNKARPGMQVDAAPATAG